MDLRSVVAPLFGVRPVKWTVPDPAAFDALLLTSANAPRHAGEGLASLTSLPCHCVGEATAAEARRAGFGDVRVGPGDGKALLAVMAGEGVRNVLHLCGRDHVGLEHPDVTISRVSVYASEAVDRLPDEAAEALRSGALALIHSPRAGRLFGRLVDTAGLDRAAIRVAGISPAAAEAAGEGWALRAAAAAPRDQALLELAAKLCNNAERDRLGIGQMSIEYVHSESAPKRRSLLSMLLIPLLAFIAGIALMGWLLTRWDAAATYLGIRPAPPPVQRAVPVAAPAPVPAPAPAPVDAERIVIDPETTRRVAQLEQRVAQISQQSQAAAGNADRAEGLLVAFAARRALDRGVPLGYIEGLLRQRFGDSQRQAVATIITAARQPVTLEELQTGLQEVGPQLLGGGPNQDWWTALKVELGDLISIRRGGTPSTLPAERLQRAKRRLDAGQVDVALAEVLRMPGHANAGEWVADARRYIAARRALDTIETAALLDPRQPPEAVPVPVPPLAPGPRTS